MERAPHLPDVRWSENADYLRGVELYNGGAFWEAHEVWERIWRSTAGDPRQHAFLQGLIQCAAACLKGEQGDVDAARRLATRALQHLQSSSAELGDVYMGLDVPQLILDFQTFVDGDPTAVVRRPRLVLAAPSQSGDMPVVELPIDGVLDLHTFQPAEVSALIDDYLDECSRRGVLELRLIHGKGRGTLLRTVHAVLERRDDVLEYRLAPPERGSWGATLVTLKARPAV